MKLKKFISGILCFSMIILSIPVAGAVDLTSTGSPSGDNKTNEQIVQDLLNNPNYSAEAKRNLMRKEALLKEVSQSATLYSINEATATAYLVNVAPIKQEDNTKCGPAVVQMVLSHMGVSYESQSNIQNAIKVSGSNATSMANVCEYLNEHQSNNIYAERYFTDEASLGLFLEVADYIDLPIIFTAKVYQSNVNAGNWPYKTGGHFTVLRGINSSGKYPIADPFYYKTYVSSSDDSGVHIRTWEDISTVNGNYGKDSYYIGY